MNLLQKHLLYPVLLGFVTSGGTLTIRGEPADIQKIEMGLWFWLSGILRVMIYSSKCTEGTKNSNVIHFEFSNISIDLALLRFICSRIHLCRATTGRRVQGLQGSRNVLYSSAITEDDLLALQVVSSRTPRTFVLRSRHSCSLRSG